MSMSTRLEASHSRSFNTNIRLMFKLIIVPERKTAASGLHYLVLLDTSESMTGEKFDSTRKVAFTMMQAIQTSNLVSLISFDNTVYNLIELSNPTRAADAVRNLKVGGGTAMYSALRYASILASRSGMPGYIILLTDGFPTDLTDLKPYEELSLPTGYRMIAIGVGKEYNEVILKLLSDRAGGLFHHLSDARELPAVLSLPSSIGAKNLKIDLVSPSKVKFLNYPNPPLTIGVLEGVTKIYGEAMIPPQFEGNISINLSWEGGQLTKDLPIRAATDQNEFLAGVNKNLIDEYKYYEALQNIVEDPSKLDLLKELSERTRRADLQETTKKISSILGETKKLSSEVTKRVRN
jgi:Ca-activated chloride channel family protein